MRKVLFHHFLLNYVVCAYMFKFVLVLADTECRHEYVILEMSDNRR